MLAVQDNNVVSYPAQLFRRRPHRHAGVREAGDVRETLRLARAWKPGVLLLDLVSRTGRV
jgi:hypothetical protein